MIKKIAILVGFLLFVSAASSRAQQQFLDYSPKILLVTAHPDDDALFSATVFKTTHLLNGTVDLALMTNGEGGYRYSTIGNYIYGKELDKEAVGRANLPGIRKKELMAGGDIVGLRNYFFFDQTDRKYSEDPAVPLENWNTSYITHRLQDIIKEYDYDFIFTMMPTPGTHSHHKTSAILTLRAVDDMEPNERPLVLSTTILRNGNDSTSFRGLEGYPLTTLNSSVKPFTFDRTQPFGHNNELNYSIIANWVIAEHKTQGTMQRLMNAGAVEQYWYYAINPEDGASKVRTFFEAVNDAPMYSDPNKID